MTLLKLKTFVLIVMNSSKLFKTECPTDLLINYVEIRNLTSIHNMEGLSWVPSLSSSHCGSILTFMMKIWRDTRERHRVKFLPTTWWCQRQCFLRCWRLCPMPGSRSWHPQHWSGEHKPVSPIRPVPTVCLSPGINQQITGKKLCQSFMGDWILIVISLAVFRCLQQCFVVFEDKWNLNMVYQVLN